MEWSAWPEQECPAQRPMARAKGPSREGPQVASCDTPAPLYSPKRASPHRGSDPFAHGSGANQYASVRPRARSPGAERQRCYTPSCASAWPLSPRRPPWRHSAGGGGPRLGTRQSRIGRCGSASSTTRPTRCARPGHDAGPPSGPVGRRPWPRPRAAPGSCSSGRRSRPALTRRSQTAASTCGRCHRVARTPRQALHQRALAAEPARARAARGTAAAGTRVRRAPSASPP